MKKEHLINKRHLEKMEETKMRNRFFPNWHIGHIGGIPKRCKIECKKFNKCKLLKIYNCKNFEGWNND